MCPREEPCGEGPGELQGDSCRALSGSGRPHTPGTLYRAVERDYFREDVVQEVLLLNIVTLTPEYDLVHLHWIDSKLRKVQKNSNKIKTKFKCFKDPHSNSNFFKPFLGILSYQSYINNLFPQVPGVSIKTQLKYLIFGLALGSISVNRVDSTY